MIRKIAICLLAAFLWLTPLTEPAPALAATPDYQQNPATLATSYNAVSLLRYYSQALDSILQKDPEATASLLNKMPFANIPPDLEGDTLNLTSSGIALSNSLAALFTLWDNQNQLLNQFLVDQAALLGDQISSGLGAARGQLQQLTIAINDTGRYLNVSTLNSQNEIRLAYEEVSAKIQRLQDMLDLLGRPLLPNMVDSLGRPLQLSSLLATQLTLEINPREAFVGDQVSCTGRLSSQGLSLQNRAVQILLNHSVSMTLTTDAAGSFRGQLTLPYWYLSELEAQAIYSPQLQDIGLYLGSASPIVKLREKFYPGSLKIVVKGQSYPGRAALLSGQIDYGQAPPLEGRAFSIYLDNLAVGSFKASTAFEAPFDLAADTSLGQHTVAVSSPAGGRYSSLAADGLFDVTQAVTILDYDLPGIAIIPGSLALRGQLHSDIGPLQQASISLSLKNGRSQILSSTDGSFDGRIKMGFGLDLIGQQPLTIQVQPQEPWNAPLTITRNVFVINLINCGLILFLLALLSFVVRRTLRAASSPRARRPLAPSGTAFPSPASLISERSGTPGSPLQIERPDQKPASGVVNWYLRALQVIQRITHSAPRPQETLGEYAAQNASKLGPLGKIFLELTRLIERALYSNRKLSTDEIDRARRLSQSIREETR